MIYLWWAVSIGLYIIILTLYVFLSRIVAKDDPTDASADNLFFAVASVITLSAMGIVKFNTGCEA